MRTALKLKLTNPLLTIIIEALFLGMKVKNGLGR